MRVYLAAAMTNASRDLATIRALVDHLESAGHEVPTRHVADAAGREPESAITHAEVARRDLAWVAGSDALVAEVSTPSHGVGVEVAAASARGVPTLLVHRAGVPVSRLLLGLPGIEVAAYADAAQARASVSRFLARVGAARPAARG
ncbi:MAG TPA: nucleoside 2-deoxyribosyltransferase [Thermoanaerobaculaceae bacterium]|nr:nucleoside 2-deoxyribosyltransferase [Thermoanaerobaculaceae bacterium]